MTDLPMDGGQMQLAESSAWYVIQSKRNAERRILSYLALRATRAFLPLLEVVRRSRTRPITLLEPLFPGYLFVCMERITVNPTSWDKVRWTPGVWRILGAEGTPEPVPQEVIGIIAARARELGFVRPGMRFAGQDRVRLLRGSLAGLEAVFDRPMSRSGRVRVLMELLGQQTGVEVDALDLEPA
jgi:transcriptional antiterminator RfaH